MSRRSDEFVRDWVSENIENGADLENRADRIGELVEELMADAEAEGIDGDELSETVGDPADYLQDVIERVQAASLGDEESEHD
jgi:nucleotide-binding universal stress UspA family protein